MNQQDNDEAIDSSCSNDENSLLTFKHMLVDVESMTEVVHYIRDRATPLGHESKHTNTPFLEHLHVIAFYQANMYKQIQAKTIDTFIQACVQG